MAVQLRPDGTPLGSAYAPAGGYQGIDTSSPAYQQYLANQAASRQKFGFNQQMTAEAGQPVQTNPNFGGNNKMATPAAPATTDPATAPSPLTRNGNQVMQTQQMAVQQNGGGTPLPGTGGTQANNPQMLGTMINNLVGQNATPPPSGNNAFPPSGAGAGPLGVNTWQMPNNTMQWSNGQMGNANPGANFSPSGGGKPTGGGKGGKGAGSAMPNPTAPSNTMQGF
jgi:hypothetical protein